MKKLPLRLIALPVLSIALGLGAQTSTTLRQAAAKANLNFGMAVGNQVWDNHQPTMDILKAQCNIMVNENKMKWENVEPERGKFTFEQVEAVVKFAEQNGMRMRGHCLLWDYQIGWAGGLNSGRADVLKAIKAHIDSVVGHFKGRIREWDVVNEPLTSSPDSSTFRNNVWMRNIGIDYIDSAFVYAHRVDPDAKLFINDFWCEWFNPKYRTYYNLVKGLKERGVPIHGVGFQCHLGDKVTKDSLSKIMKQLGALGLMVSLTEIDIGNTSNSADGWKMLMGACLENPNCQSFLTWGVDDNHSWLGSGCNCLLYTGSLQPKTISVNALITAMDAANPAIAAARKVFGNTGIVREIRFPAHPNSTPIRSRSGITYMLNEAANVRLDIITMSGKKVSTLVNARQSMGEQTIAWNENKVLPGIYLCRLQINGEQEIAKMVVGR